MFGHEFQIHDRVNELLKLLGYIMFKVEFLFTKIFYFQNLNRVQNAKEIAPSISEHMEKNRVPFNPAAVLF
jgi:hypothetical protein